VGNQEKKRQSGSLFLQENSELFGFLKKSISVDLENFGCLGLVPSGRLKDVENNLFLKIVSNFKSPPFLESGLIRPRRRASRFPEECPSDP
jgi:hypothetical protein